MADSQDDGENYDERQCGPNHTGHIYRCAVCLKKTPPVALDGANLIPVCLECWSKISPTNKLTVVAFFRNSKAVESLSCSIREYINNQGIAGGYFGGRKKNSEN